MEPVWGQRVGKHEEVNVEGNSRRDFLKKAGVAAWTVPAVQVVNMSGALAGVTNTSVTTTSPPTTAPKPPCTEFVYYRLKADWNGGGYTWTKGEGNQDCLTGGDWEDLIPNGLPIFVDGDDEMVEVSHELPGCEIYMAMHKAGSARQGQHCFPATIAADGSSAVFMKGDKDISHIELIVKCCADD